MELYLSDHPLDCLTCAANGIASSRIWPGNQPTQVRYDNGGAIMCSLETTASPMLNGSRRMNPIPILAYDPSKCIVCNRCVRACEETQGAFALTIDGRGFDSRVSPGMSQASSESDVFPAAPACRRCPNGDACRKVGDRHRPARTFRRHNLCLLWRWLHFQGGDARRGNRPDGAVEDGKANHGHSCIKGRFAYGWATHRERILNPMIGETITDPWREVSWEEAIAHAASEFKRIQAAIWQALSGGITSSRCTSEEAYLVQKLIRSGFGNNNVDTCARVCHSPTGYGLSQAFGTSAGTRIRLRR